MKRHGSRTCGQISRHTLCVSAKNRKPSLRLSPSLVAGCLVRLFFCSLWQNHAFKEEGEEDSSTVCISCVAAAGLHKMI